MAFLWHAYIHEKFDRICKKGERVVTWHLPNYLTNIPPISALSRKRSFLYQSWSIRIEKTSVYWVGIYTTHLKNSLFLVSRQKNGQTWVRRWWKRNMRLFCNCDHLIFLIMVEIEGLELQLDVFRSVQSCIKHSLLLLLHLKSQISVKSLQIWHTIGSGILSQTNNWRQLLNNPTDQQVCSDSKYYACFSHNIT